MNNINIMVIEDDIDLSELIHLYLMPEGWNIDIFHTGKEALNSFNKNEYSLILLDLLLPDINGFDICKKIRESSIVPIIIITALESSVNMVQGLNIGADDYIKKPFEPSEVVARIKSKLRRTYEFSNPSNIDSSEIIVNNLRLSKKSHKGYYSNIEIDLTPKEFDILWLMMKEPDKVHNMEDIHYKIWGDDIIKNEVNPVMVHIRRIRGKFEKIGINSIITTVWGVGYKINA